MTPPRRTPLAVLVALLTALAAVVARRRRTGETAAPPGPTAVTDDRVRLHVEVDRPPAGGDGPTVVFVHGFTAQLGEFDLQRDAVRRAGLGAVLYDQRGHGRSAWGPPKHATIDQLGRDLACVLEQAVPPGPVVLVGHSMGGMTLMALARQRPELFGTRVTGAFLLATSAGELVDAGPLGQAVRLLTRLHLLGLYLRVLRLWSPVLERFRRKGTAAGRAFTRHYLFGREDAGDDALVREVQAMLEQTPLTITAAFYPTFVTHDELASLAVLRAVPTTIVCGTDDRLTPLAHSRRMAAELPDAELVVVPGTGHSVNVTRPEVVDAALLRLVDRARALSPAVSRAALG